MLARPPLLEQLNCSAFEKAVLTLKIYSPSCCHLPTAEGCCFTDRPWFCRQRVLLETQQKAQQQNLSYPSSRAMLAGTLCRCGHPYQELLINECM